MRKNKFNTSYENFALEYDHVTGELGDYTNRHTLYPMFLKIIGDPSKLKIYDIGCSNGAFDRWLVMNGAKDIFASDISQTLIRIAETKYPKKYIEYSKRDGIDFRKLRKDSFDLVIMNLSVSYIDDVDLLLEGVSRILKLGGRFIYSVDHPLKYSAYADFGKSDFDHTQYEVRQYLKQRRKVANNHWTGERSLNIFVRPLNFYINSCEKVGLFTKNIYEPVTIAEFQKKKVSTKIPFKIICEAIKT